MSDTPQEIAAQTPVQSVDPIDHACGMISFLRSMIHCHDDLSHQEEEIIANLLATLHERKQQFQRERRARCIYQWLALYLDEGYDDSPEDRRGAREAYARYTEQGIEPTGVDYEYTITECLNQSLQKDAIQEGK